MFRDSNERAKKLPKLASKPLATDSDKIPRSAGDSGDLKPGLNWRENLKAQKKSTPGTGKTAYLSSIDSEVTGKYRRTTSNAIANASRHEIVSAEPDEQAIEEQVSNQFVDQLHKCD